MDGPANITATAVTAPAVDDTALERELLDLVYADDELMRAEFDAIVAASWGASARVGRTGGSHAGPGPGLSRTPAAGHDGGGRPGEVASGRPRSSARSPPDG